MNLEHKSGILVLVVEIGKLEKLEYELVFRLLFFSLIKRIGEPGCEFNLK